MLPAAVYLPQRFVYELPVQHGWSRARHHPAEDTSSTCGTARAEVCKERVKARSASSPEHTEQQTALGQISVLQIPPSYSCKLPTADPRRKSTGTSAGNEQYFISCRLTASDDRQLRALWSRRLHLRLCV